jgi:3-oxoacyl-[acyl-carrier protein] reductase
MLLLGGQEQDQSNKPNREKQVMQGLKGKVAIITGGAQGIGFAAVKKFAIEGVQVVIWDVNQEKAQQVLAALKEQNLSADFQKVDVTQFESTGKAAADIIKKYGQVNILINNAGITRDATLLKITTEQWEQVIDVNLKGVFNCTKAVASYMMERQWGRIINTSSVVGIYGNFGQTNYVATKAGVIGMTKVWARELGRKGITVNAVVPGFIATEMIDTIPEKIIQMVKDKTPLGRLGAPEDIANAYFFLAGEEAGFINGAVLSVDGGITI